MLKPLLLPMLMLKLMLTLMPGVMDTAADTVVVDTDTADMDVDTEDMADTDTTVARGPLNLMLNPIPGVTTVAHMDTVTAIAMAAGDTVDMATTDKCHLSSKV